MSSGARKGPWGWRDPSPWEKPPKPDETSSESRAHAPNREQPTWQERTHRSQQHKGDARAAGDTLEALFATGDRAVLEWTTSPGTDYSQCCVRDDATSDDVAHALFAALTAMRQERDRAIEMVRLLVGERKEIREFIPAQSRSRHQADDSQSLTALYGRVGLNENCPEFLIRHARRCYLSELHPDRHSPEHRAEAEKRFKEAKAVFDEIVRLRGLSKSS